MLKAFENKHKRGRSCVDITQVFLWNLKILLLLFLSTSQPLKSAQSQQRQSHSPGVTGRTANLAKQKRFHVWRERNSWKWLHSLDILQHNILHHITPMKLKPIFATTSEGNMRQFPVVYHSTKEPHQRKHRCRCNFAEFTRILQKRGCLWNRTHMHTCTANIWAPSSRN